MATRVQVAFDCTDPDRVARFGAAALDYKLQDPFTGYASWEAFLAAQGVPKLDLKVGGGPGSPRQDRQPRVDAAAERLIGLGVTPLRVQDENGTYTVVM
jgi:Glyoxalase-like domain